MESPENRNIDKPYQQDMVLSLERSQLTAQDTNNDGDSANASAFNLLSAGKNDTIKS